MPIGPMGHVYDWREVDAYVSRADRPVFGAAAAPLKDSGKGKTVLLHLLVAKVLGAFLPSHLQTIGDCVSHGTGKAVDVVKCVEIASGEEEEFVAETATEPIYAYSRVEVGKGQRGTSDGSVGAWGMEAIKAGTLLRRKYDSVDLTTYNGQLAKKWGKPKAGVPDDLEPTMREHPIQTASLVTTYEEVRDAIANGYPVVVCSNQGFTTTRDKDGFAGPSGSWAHCMYLLAVDDAFKRPGCLCDNSWGDDWITGPKRLEQPNGSFWIDAQIIHAMVSRNQDSYAISGYQGFPKRDLDFDIF